MSHDKKPSEVNQNSVANDNGNRFKPLDVNDIRLKEVSGDSVCHDNLPIGLD